MTISPLDFVLLQLGTPGYYLGFLGFLICCLQLPIIFVEYAFKFYIYEPPHRCRLSSNEIESTHLKDGSNQFPTQNRFRTLTTWKDLNVHKNEWYPLVQIENRYHSNRFRSNIEQILSYNNSVKTSQIFDQCQIYIDPVHHWKGKQSCPQGWEYWTPNQEQTLVTEFNLVCENRFLQNLLTILIAFSAIFGAYFFGLLSDKFGRSRTLNLAIYLLVASALSVYFVSDFFQFTIFYNLQVFFVNGLQISAYITLLELFPTPYQLKANFSWFTFRSLVMILSAILISTINDWRYLQLSIAVPSFAFITYLFVLPESPLWQTVVKRNQSQACKTLINFSKFSGRTIPLNQLNQHIQNLLISSAEFNQNLSNLYETPINGVMNQSQPIELSIASSIPRKSPSFLRPGPILRWYLLTNFYLIFVSTIISSELFDKFVLNLDQNIHIDSIYNCLIDLAFTIIAYHISLCFGSKIIQSLFFFVNGFLIIISLILREYLQNKSLVEVYSFDFRFLLVPPILMVIARSLGKSILIFVLFHSAKTIPTNIRATGLGFCIFWIQIAKFTVTYLITLAEYLPFNSLHYFFGILALISGGMSLLYPCLEQRPFPNILVDLEEEKKLSRRNGRNYYQWDCSNDRDSASKFATKQYPSYQDLKFYRFSNQNFTNPITPPTEIIKDEEMIFTIDNDHHNQYENNRQKSYPAPFHQDKDQSFNEMINYGRQRSLSSNSSAKIETEKTSISSNGGSGGGGGGASINDNTMFTSPSSSFQTQMISKARPSYIAYNNHLDPFIIELESKLQQQDRSSHLIINNPINIFEEEKRYEEESMKETNSIHI
ncbi:Solute carrier family 22 member 6-A [Sarcoptes scabiei]|uniref:Solute carrier family 22 member 6-A n=1 Tax=Sarcoptes scabiei TaxID=52283 RepID=A0A834R2T0_SARSC|nr:Solute carrier family 22 member 6-A [Sarcoptes scabiei]